MTSPIPSSVCQLIEDSLGRLLTHAEQEILRDRWERFAEGFRLSLAASLRQKEEAQSRVRKESVDAIEDIIAILDEAHADLPESNARKLIFSAIEGLDGLLPRPRGAPHSFTKTMAVRMFDRFVEKEHTSKEQGPDGRIVDVVRPNPLRLEDEVLVRRLVVQCCEAGTGQKSVVTEDSLRRAVERARRRPEEG
jgi:hypothetical protein